MAERKQASAKRTRQYEKIKKSVKKAGSSTATAKRIAAATTNKTVRARSEVKGRSKARRATSRTKKAASSAPKTVAPRSGGKGSRTRK
jgi:hypothetical protein